MREILFKAKRIDNGEWVEGAYFPMTKYPTKENHALIWVWTEGAMGCDYDMGYTPYRIDSETLCQYTGLTDKNGNKIWENDVVFVTDDDGCSGQIDTGLGEIDFIEGLWYISGRVQNSLYDINKCFQIEVIGTTFDNPELMKGE